MQLLIKGTKYKVTFNPEFCGYYGQTNTKYKTIELYKFQGLQELKNTLIHEFTHAYLYECGLVQYCDNEDICYWFEHVYFDMLDNVKKVLKCKS